MGSAKLWSLRNAGLVGGFATCVILLLVFVIGERWTTDDALISFRYVDNFTSGDGLVYNLGERLESFSSPLFVLLLSPFGLMGADLFSTAQGLGIAFSVAELVLIFALLRRFGWLPLAAVLAGVLFATDRIVHVWSTGGLETAMYSALLFACFAMAVTQARSQTPERWVTRAAVAHVLLAMGRPEGIAFYPIYLAVTAVAARKDGAWKRPLIKSLIIVGGALLVLLAIRYLYYGALLPHTYYAKVSGVPVAEFGSGYVLAFAKRVGFANVHVLAWLAVVAVFIASLVVARMGEPEQKQAEEHGQLVTVGLVGAVYVGLALLIIRFEGGDYMTDFRFMRPIMGILFVSAAALLGHAIASRGKLPVQLAAVAAGIGLIVSHAQLQVFPAKVFTDAPSAVDHKKNNAATKAQAARFAKALALITNPGDKILTDVSGYKGYGHKLHTVDATGLTSPTLEGNFYLRRMWATKTYRDRLPGHARWPKVEFMTREGFALITPKVSKNGHNVSEVSDASHRRYKRYPYLHVTLGLGDGSYLRFFTTLSADELDARGKERKLDMCWRARRQKRPFCAGQVAVPPHAERPKPTKAPGIEAKTRAPARTPEEAAKQYFGAMDAADCKWLRSTTVGPQAQRDAQITCQQLEEKLKHMQPVRLWSIDDVRPGRENNQRLMRVKFFLQGQDREKVMRVEHVDGVWRVLRL